MICVCQKHFIPSKHALKLYWYDSEFDADIGRLKCSLAIQIFCNAHGAINKQMQQFSAYDGAYPLGLGDIRLQQLNLV